MVEILSKNIHSTVKKGWYEKKLQPQTEEKKERKYKEHYTNEEGDIDRKEEMAKMSRIIKVVIGSNYST